MNVVAVVSENNGEISCSKEETNRIRALLGMRPLYEADSMSKEEKEVQRHRAKMEEAAAMKEEEAVRSRIHKAREKRLLNAKLDGATLGNVTEVAEDAALTDASEWVRRSRKKAMTDATVAKSSKSSKTADDSRYESNDLSGMRIKHNAADFAVGEEVIMTLANSEVLQKDERGRVVGLTAEEKDEDILENSLMADVDKRKDRKKELKRNRDHLMYRGYDDEEFDGPSMNSVGERSILSQYDKVVKADFQFKLGEGGVAKGDTEKGGNGQAAYAMAEEASQSSVLIQSLNANKVAALTSDYYTPTEFAAFSKPKTKKIRKIRKKDTADEEVGSAAALEAAIGASDGAEISHDRRSRSQMVAPSVSLKQEESAKRSKYDSAVALAGEKSRITYSTATVAAVVEEDDIDISQCLARSRRLALLAASNTGTTKEPKEDAGAAEVLGLIGLQTKTNDNIMLNKSSVGADIGDSSKKDSELEDDSVDAEGRRSDGRLVFSDTTEFTTRLQARLNEKSRSRAEMAVKDMERSEEIVDLPKLSSSSKKSEKKIEVVDGIAAVASSGWTHDDNDKMEVENEAFISEFVQAKAADVDSDDDMHEEGDMLSQEENMLLAAEHGDEEDDTFMHQPLAKQSLAATLQLLKESGELKQATQLTGRANDKREINPSDSNYNVKLEYRDKEGRLLTQKEAFRQLSYRFHGYGPGTKKREKRRQEMEAKNKASTSRDAMNSGTMQSLTRTQEATGKAHVVIQGGSHSGINAAELAQTIAKQKAKDAKKKASSA